MRRIRFRTFCMSILLMGAALPAAGGPGAQADQYYVDDPLLGQLIEVALRDNPSLQQSLAEYRSALQRIPQVTALPDPTLSFTQFLSGIETRVGPQRNSVSLAQKLPWFGKLELSGQVAFKRAASRLQAHRALQNDVVAQTKTLFYQLSSVDRQIQITEQEKLLLSDYEAIAQGRYASGRGLQQTVIKLQTEITKATDRLKSAQLQRRHLASRINLLTNRVPESSVAQLSPPQLPPLALELEPLYRLGAAHRPELKSAMALIEGDEKSIQLSGKSFWPDFTLSAGYVNVADRSDPAARLMPPPDNGRDAYSLSLGFNIPLRRGKYRASVLEATERVIARRKGYLQLHNEMRFQIRDQVLRLETLQERMALLESLLLPQAEAALHSAEAAYQTGKLEALDLLDSLRVLLEVQRIESQHHSDYLVAMAQLERAVGTRFPR